MSLIGVVTGGSSAKARDKKMMTLLDKYFGVPEHAKYVALDNQKKVVYKKKTRKVKYVAHNHSSASKKRVTKT